jgi:hypothetical protein
MKIKTDSLKLNNVSTAQIHTPLKIFSAFKQRLTVNNMLVCKPYYNAKMIYVENATADNDEACSKVKQDILGDKQDATMSDLLILNNTELLADIGLSFKTINAAIDNNRPDGAIRVLSSLITEVESYKTIASKRLKNLTNDDHSAHLTNYNIINSIYKDLIYMKQSIASV